MGSGVGPWPPGYSVISVLSSGRDPGHGRNLERSSWGHGMEEELQRASGTELTKDMLLMQRQIEVGESEGQRRVLAFLLTLIAILLR